MGPLRKRTRSHQLGGLTSLTIDCKRLSRDLSHLLWHCNLQSCIMLEECLVPIRDTCLAAATSSKKTSFFHKIFSKMADLASLANTPKMSVAALLAASPVSTAVLSDPGSPNVLSLPSPVAQPKALAPEELSSRLDKAFGDLVDKKLPSKYVESHVWDDSGRDVDRGASCLEQNFAAATCHSKLSVMASNHS